MIKIRRKLNVVTGDPPAVIRMSQYDTDVVLEFELYASDGIFTVEPDTAVIVRGVKPDGNGISIDGTLQSVQDRYKKETTYIARIEVDEQMTAVAGKAHYKLCLISGEKELNTGFFSVNVDRAALDKDALPSKSVIREITDTIDRTDEFLAASRTITKAQKEIADNAKSAQDAKDAAVEAAKEANEGAALIKEALATAETAQKALVELKSATVAAVAAVEDSKERIAHDLEMALESILRDIESKRVALIGDVDMEKLDLKAIAKGLVDDVNSAKSAAITDIEAEAQKQMSEINSRESLFVCANDEVLATANQALETARETQKTVSDFVNTQGNLRGRIDAMEVKVYEEVKKG